MKVIKTEAIIQEILEEINPETYQEYNYQEEVVYPYLTYTLMTDKFDTPSDLINININIFDYSTSYEDSIRAKNDLVNALDNKYIHTDVGLMAFQFIRSQKIPTGDDSVKRLDVDFTIRLHYKEPREINVDVH